MTSKEIRSLDLFVSASYFASLAENDYSGRKDTSPSPNIYSNTASLSNSILLEKKIVSLLVDCHLQRINE